MHSLKIELLGQFNLTDGEPIRGVGTPRLQSLLAYLVLHPVSHARQHLAFMFWPESTEAQARTNLRRELHHLRQSLPEVETYLLVEASAVQWRPDAPYTLDVRTFETAVAEAERFEQARDFPIARERWMAAARAYRGDLLPGGYDAWLLAERERLAQRYARGLERLVGLLEADHAWAAAIDWANRLLQQDPLREATYRTLIRLHSLAQDRSSALRVYHNCVTVLQRELGVEPEAATHALYQQLASGSEPGQAPSLAAPPVDRRPPLVGRQREWALCEAAWKTAQAGQARVLCLAGEAGIGKSRLAEELQLTLSRQGLPTAWARCYAAEGELAFAPLAAWLKSPALKTAHAHLEPVWLAELVRVLPQLLVERPDLPAPQPLTENWQRLRFFEALARAVLAVRQPLLLILDDVQWCEADTLAWLHYLLRFDPAARLLILVTVRLEDLPAATSLPAWLAALRHAGQLTEVGLGALDAAETAALAAQLIGRTANADLAQLIFQETEGNPLFVVETVRTRIAGPGWQPNPAAPSGLARPAPGALDPPSRVHSVIAARLAQLTPSARELAGLAATIGRAFTFPVLMAASERTEEAVTHDLDDLWQRRLVRERGGEAYDFSHDKIREVAYAQLSSGHRRLLHRRIAQALERVHAGALETVSHQVAAHYDQAGLPAQALPFYQRAAAVAQALYANEEAVSLLNKALAALVALPPGAERDEQELALQTALGVPLVALKGYASPEVRSVYSRARQLCQALRRAPEAPVLRALALTSIVRSEFQEACDLAEQLRRPAEHTGDRTLLVEAHYVLGVSRFWLGEFQASRAHLEHALAAYDPAQRPAHIALFAQDPAVVCRVRLAYALWYLGFPDQARALCAEGLALGHDVGHPFSLAYSLNFAAWYANDRGDPDLTRQLVAATQTLAAEQGFSLWSMMSGFIGGWVQVEQGMVEAGIQQIRSGLTEYSQNGAHLGRTYYLALLARAYARQGQYLQSLGALDEALATAARGEERWYVAELNRLRGEVMHLAGASATEVEAQYQLSREIAQGQQARSLALRTAMSLSRLWQSQGKRQAARDLLGAAYAAFDEGFDSPDLVEAHTLLQALA